MNPIIKIALKYFLIQLIWLLIAFYVTDQTFIVPELIPYTPIRTGGVIFTFIAISTIIFFEKELLRITPNLTVGYLTFYSAALWFVTELFFQAFRQSTLPEDRLHHFLVAMTGMTLFNSIVSFLVAFQLKTKRIDRLITFIVAILVLFAILLKIFPNLAKP